MKKISAIILGFLGIFLCGFFIFIPIANNASAMQVRKHLEEIPLPEKTEHIEGISAAGKLTGNGNGMQYFGAVLLKSELNMEEIDTHYSAYKESEWDCLIEVQTGQEIEVIDHGMLSFKEEMISEENYYMVYSWGSGNEVYGFLDIRGH